MELLSLPKLNPLLKIYPSNPSFDGHPQWTLYHPISNKYFVIGWQEYECLSRFHKFEAVQELLQSIKKETNLNIDAEDIATLIKFLNENGLLNRTKNEKYATNQESFIKKIIHGYLYFTFPVLRPEKFLQKTLPYLKPLFLKNVTFLMLLLLLISVMVTLPRMDEFLNSFTQLMTLEGAILGIVIYTLIKILHEFGHAYAAAKYGVAVPHMGVAFILLYPIFYTEVSGVWRLTDKKQRMIIGLSGVIIELYIATFALIIWNFLTPGLGQMIAFSVIMISLAGSLLINLNPLMRFDGYYVLSDWTGIENLHSTSIDYAKNKLRQILLGLTDAPPHTHPDHIVKSLTYFGFSVIIYRFFLFLGIALLVYHIFFKPLGLIMMLFEIFWFIALPIWKEIEIWYARKHEYINNKQFKRSVLFVLSIIVFCTLPIKFSIFAPAVVHVEKYQIIYAPAPAVVEKIYISDNQKVSKGQMIALLSSPLLERDIKLTEEKLSSLKLLKRKNQTFNNVFTPKDLTIDDKIKLAEIELTSLQKKKRNLQIIADFDGVVTDLNPELTIGQTVHTEEALMRISIPNNILITAYIYEEDVSRIKVGNKAFFRPSYSILNSYSGNIVSIDPVNIKVLDFPILASVHQSDIPVMVTKKGLEPLNTIYKIQIKPNLNNNKFIPKTIVPGHVKIKSDAESIVIRFLKICMQIFRNNIALNSK